MRELHGGVELARAVDLVLPQLPAGELTLVATSIEGTALAAACAMRRAPLPTYWARLDVHRLARQELAGRVIVIEPVSAGNGWRRTIERRLPDATFLVPEADVRQLVA